MNTQSKPAHLGFDGDIMCYRVNLTSLLILSAALIQDLGLVLPTDLFCSKVVNEVVAADRFLHLLLSPHRIFSRFSRQLRFGLEPQRGTFFFFLLKSVLSEQR